MTNPITPDVVRALIADTEPRPPLLPDGRNPALGQICPSCGHGAVIRDVHAQDCPVSAELRRLWLAQLAMERAAPAIAAAYLAVCAERDEAPPPADAELLALANRTMAADLERVRAERDRLARVLAVECGDASQARAGWAYEHSTEWSGPNGSFTYRSRPGRWVWASNGQRGEAPTAYEAMEAADRAGGSDV